MSEPTYEEDIEAALEKCVEYLGRIGKMETKPVYYNAVLYTEKYGKLWYGDLTKSDLELLPVLSTDIEATIEIRDNT